MKLGYFLGAALISGLAMPVSAQSIQSDVRCILLSGMFVKAAKDDRGKQLARATGAFYLGRINGRADARTITDALRGESKTITAKTAGSQMQVCAAKLAEAEKSLNAMGRTLQPDRK